MNKTRRKFLKQSGQAGLGIGLLGLTACSQKIMEVGAASGMVDTSDLFFDISLAQWSLNKAFFGGKLDNLDFAMKAKNDFGIGAIEYVNQFFKDKGEDMAYLKEMKMRADDNGVKSLLIMIDREGGLGDTDDAKRKKAVENHYKWVEAAKFLGCHSIRVNAYGEGTASEVSAAAADGLGRLSEFAKQSEINVIVENHGGYSSNGKWLTAVMNKVNMDNCGTLPDFGNFCIKRKKGSRDCEEEYDRYKGVKELMQHAKAVSAKSHDFDDNGNETNTDYTKILKIVKDAGYRGYIGIEYEGSGMSADEGIIATRDLLIKAGKALS
ncbi:MAG: sugar phosphate isomerase/epimerase family protein [Bacteroidota bacterium]